MPMAGVFSLTAGRAEIDCWLCRLMVGRFGPERREEKLVEPDELAAAKVILMESPTTKTSDRTKRSG